LTCIPVHKSAEPDSLAIASILITARSSWQLPRTVYYLTDHYVNYRVVLVRLARIHPDALRDLLGMAWRFVTARTVGGKRGVGRKGLER
jgi:hypothetical protein